jgi:hypothetical protein
VDSEAYFSIPKGENTERACLIWPNIVEMLETPEGQFIPSVITIDTAVTTWKAEDAVTVANMYRAMA